MLIFSGSIFPNYAYYIETEHLRFINATVLVCLFLVSAVVALTLPGFKRIEKLFFAGLALVYVGALLLSFWVVPRTPEWHYLSYAMLPGMAVVFWIGYRAFFH